MNTLFLNTYKNDNQILIAIVERSYVDRIARKAPTYESILPVQGFVVEKTG